MAIRPSARSCVNNGHIADRLTAAAVRDQPEVLHRHLGGQCAARTCVGGLFAN
jgi:hypothetical protein